MKQKINKCILQTTQFQKLQYGVINTVKIEMNVKFAMPTIIPSINFTHTARELTQVGKHFDHPVSKIKNNFNFVFVF
jgi:hypothetical protein